MANHSEPWQERNFRINVFRKNRKERGANHDDLFNFVGVKKCRYVANSDFHGPWHVCSWETLVKSEKNIETIKEVIKKDTEVVIYLMRRETD